MKTAPSLRKEFVLLAACARWPADERRAAAIQSAAAAAIDWAGFLRVVGRHRLHGLVHHGLRQSGIAVPPDIAEAIGREAGRIARDNLAAAAESLRLQRAFDQAGITAVFFKGMTLARLAFGELALRHSRDIDLLVTPDKLAAAMTLLEGMGFRRTRPAAAVDAAQLAQWLRGKKEAEYLHPRTGLCVELHWRLCENTRLLPDVPAEGSWEMVPVSATQALRTLGPEDRFAYLCTHGATHGWFRLKWLADIGALLAGLTPAQIEQLYRTAEQKGAGPCAAQALVLCNQLFETPLPPVLAEGFAADRRITWLVSLALSALTSGNAEVELEDRRFGTTPVSLSRYLIGSGPRYWWAELQTQLTSFDDIALIPLPRGLRFLYPLLRLPLWSWRQLRRGRRVLPARSPF